MHFSCFAGAESIACSETAEGRTLANFVHGYGRICGSFLELAGMLRDASCDIPGGVEGIGVGPTLVGQ